MAGRLLKRYVTGAVASGIDENVTFDCEVKVLHVLGHFSASTTDTLTISVDEESGANYDTVISTTDLSSDANVKVDLNQNLAKGDALNIAMTTNTTANAYFTVIAEIR